MSNLTSKTSAEYWRAGCECARAGLCYRCRAAAEIESLQRQVDALSRLSAQAVTEAQREKDKRNAVEPPAAPPQNMSLVDLVKPCHEWPDLVAGIRELYDETREGHMGCAEIALAAAAEIERLRTAQPPSACRHVYSDGKSALEIAGQGGGYSECRICRASFEGDPLGRVAQQDEHCECGALLRFANERAQGACNRCINVQTSLRPSIYRTDHDALPWYVKLWRRMRP